MKIKNIITLASILIPMSLFGAEYPSDGTYNIKWDGTHWVNTGNWETSGYQTSAFDVNSDKIGKKTETTFTALRDVSMTVEVVKNESGKSFSVGFFTYDVDNKGKIVINSENSFSDVNVGSSVTSDNFSANEMVGIFVETDNYKIYSISALNTHGTVLIGADGSYGSAFNENLPTKENNQAGFWFNTQYDYNPGWVKSDIVILAHGSSASVPVGAPLPGVLSTICISILGFSNYYRNHKRKN